MLKNCKVTKVKVLLSVLVSVFIQFNFNSFKSVAAILEKGLLLLLLFCFRREELSKLLVVHLVLGLTLSDETFPSRSCLCTSYRHPT